MIKGFIVTRTKKGVHYESGPNAILLSDVSIQNGQFCNLAEFPVMQMFYRQAMIIPGHPNNSGSRPMLIGNSGQIAAQSEYIRRGNYGLDTVEELAASGVSPAIAEMLYRVKLRYAYGRLKKSEELIDFRTLESAPLKIDPGIVIQRTGLNVFKISYKNENVTIDLNLQKGEEYLPPINLDFHRIRREYFSIIHIGEGDGWALTKPCMSSIITFQGKIYLIDTGPNILYNLTALGISVNEIEGIFLTHAHDDHFAGLTSLVRSDHRIHYYATPLVRASVSKKLSALMSITDKRFQNSFVVHDLDINEWNRIGGLEVMPVLSPHPVETSVLFFRTFWENGYRTYAHLADIPSRKILDELFKPDMDNYPVARELYENFLFNINAPADLKKIDIGGGMIHGCAEDFAGDKSRKIVLSHISRELTPREKEIGSNASFGQEDILIHSNKDYFMQSAYVFLGQYFPSASHSDIDMLLNCPTRVYNVGEIIIKKGELNSSIYLLLEGVAEYIDSENNITYRLSSGSFIGEYSALYHEPSKRTYRAESNLCVMSFPVAIYDEFIKHSVDQADLKRGYELISFLQSTYLFGEMISSIIHHWLSKKIRIIKLKPGEESIPGDGGDVFIVFSGEADITAENTVLETVSHGDFFGEEIFLLGSSNIFHLKARTDLELAAIPCESLRNIPIVEWKLYEAFEKRIYLFGMLASSKG